MALAVGKFIENLGTDLSKSMAKNNIFEDKGVPYALADISQNLEYILLGKPPHFPVKNYDNIPPEKATNPSMESAKLLATYALQNGVLALEKKEINVAAERIEKAIAYLRKGDFITELPKGVRSSQRDGPQTVAQEILLEIMKTIGAQLDSDNVELRAARDAAHIAIADKSLRQGRGR